MSTDSKAANLVIDASVEPFQHFGLTCIFLGEVDWEVIHPVVALILGFRGRDGAVIQDQSLSPIGWEDLDEIPDLADIDNQTIATKLLSDLPDDEESTGFCDCLLIWLGYLTLFNVYMYNHRHCFGEPLGS